MVPFGWSGKEANARLKDERWRLSNDTSFRYFSFYYAEDSSANDIRDDAEAIS